MTEKTGRPLPPPLEPVLPDCSICGTTVDTREDEFYCGHCDAWWSMSTAFNEEGEWEDNVGHGQCESTKDDERCILTDGHEREHRDGDDHSWAGKVVWRMSDSDHWVAASASAEAVSRMARNPALAALQDPTKVRPRPGKEWAVKHPNYTLVPQTEACAQYTQSKIPGSVLVQWNGSEWAEPSTSRA